MHGRSDSMVSTSQAALSCTCQAYSSLQCGTRLCGTLDVCACSQCTQPVTFALISYSYAPASTSIIRPSTEIAWVFQRETLWTYVRMHVCMHGSGSRLIDGYERRLEWCFTTMDTSLGARVLGESWSRGADFCGNVYCAWMLTL